MITYSSDDIVTAKPTDKGGIMRLIDTCLVLHMDSNNMLVVRPIAVEKAVMHIEATAQVRADYFILSKTLGIGRG